MNYKYIFYFETALPQNGGLNNLTLAVAAQEFQNFAWNS
jgi:hypothetical protein